ncbi:MAG: alpha/beta fold hydrolase [Burkholderiales bacterium]
MPETPSQNAARTHAPLLSTVSPYQARRASESRWVSARGLRHHLRVWEPDPSRPCAGDLWMLHGWMDVSASFQFLVDALAGNWRVFAPDWRGFGLSERPAADCYWFPDYFADLEAVLDQVAGDAPVDLIAHSMGGNVAMIYAGVRPQRVRRLINLEGIGLQGVPAEQTPERYAQWLDELRAGARMRDYESLAAVAARLMQTNPGLGADKAGFLAGHWARATPQGRFEILGDPAHKHVNPVIYRVDEITACWQRIEAPVLLILAGLVEPRRAFLHTEPFQRRLRAVRSLSLHTLEGAGHMVHHDRPEALAPLIEAFLARPLAPADAPNGVTA